MSINSNNYGRAYEFVYLEALKDEISRFKKVIIHENSSYQAAKRAWESIEHPLQSKLETGARATISTLFELEPRLTDRQFEPLELMIQKDSQGVLGDVRDILILKNSTWQVGLSLKHNHFAVKHSRLSKSLDFGEKWLHTPCSPTYWKEVIPIFEQLSKYRKQGLKWKELPNKDSDIYLPLLNAFIKEILYINSTNQNTLSKLIEYLLGQFDFYKIVALDNFQTSQIQAFNLYGTLNQKAENVPSIVNLSRCNLPTKILKFYIKPSSTNTAEISLDNNWSLSFRIHNASTLVEPSLKFDIQLINMPETVETFICSWLEI